MQLAVPAGQGAMAAVLALAADQVAEACREAAEETGLVVAAANLNSPTQTVISGALAAVERASALAKAKGARRAVMLPVSAPFHCALMLPAQEEVARVLGGLDADRSQHAGGSERDGRADLDGRRGEGCADAPGDGHGALGGLRAGRWWRPGLRTLSRWGRARCCAGC
jgi:malonyl CoA-acyl carrier protein transacylase